MSARTAAEAMREAVTAGRMMRVAQRYYVQSGRRDGYERAVTYEADFDRLSLEAVKLDQQEKEAGQ